jgi:UDP-N-acetylglucosamine 2-epimerase
MKKLAVVVGARPQFIKLAPLVEVLADKTDLIIIHTGQHYDFEMSDIFFSQLKLPEVAYHLGVGSAGHAEQTGNMMIGLEKVFTKEQLSMIIVIGDTNSTLAGAIAAAKNDIPIAHVEAGLRSKNNHLPEQINRIVADRLSSVLCCPDQSSVENLRGEGITGNVHLTGDILYDLIGRIDPDPGFVDSTLNHLGLAKDEFIFMTLHRAENVDRSEFLKSIIGGLESIGEKVFLPLHPRTEKNLEKYDLLDALRNVPNVIVSKPVGIIESLALTKSSLGIITDSGGIQREAAYFGKRAYILRDETEWLELEGHGAVICIRENLGNTDFDWRPPVVPAEYFKKASERIISSISNFDY